MIERGTGSFEFGLRRGGRDLPLTVWTYRPPSFGPESPIVMVMHGVTRDGRGYRDAWIAAAEEYGALVLAPEFSKTVFPSPREYEVGNMRDRERHPLPAAEWALRAVEELFEAVRDGTGSARRGYRLFGHSAGGQFVHRLLTFVPDCRTEATVVANSGCYTLLDEAERFPYGLGGMPLGDDAVARVLGRDVTILLGEDDCDPDAPMLLKSPEAMRQGEHRLARGRTYHRHSRMLAQRMGVPFGWKLVTLPGVGHSHRAMAAPAARILLGPGPASL